MKNLKGAFMKDVYAYNFRYLETSYYLNGRFFFTLSQYHYQSGVAYFKRKIPTY